AWLAFIAFVLIVASMRQAVRDVPHGFWERSTIRLKYLAGFSSLRSRAALDEELYYVADYNLGANLRVAEAVAERTQPDDHVYVWGFEPSIYWLSERAPASRFIYNVPQRAQWQQRHARQLLIKELQAVPPAIVVVQQNDVFSAVTGDHLDSKSSLMEFTPLSRMLDTRYELVSVIEDFEIYERIEPEPSKEVP